MIKMVERIRWVSLQVECQRVSNRQLYMLSGSKVQCKNNSTKGIKILETKFSKIFSVSLFYL